LADLMDRFATRVAAVAEIPLTLMYGQAPGGLNATGEADTRGYYDRVKVRQTLDIEPNMTILDECIIASALGNRPEEIHYNWRPLWQVSEKEIAENADKITSAAEKLERIGVPMEAVARSTVNALTEIGAFPGLEAEFSTAFEAESDGDAGDVDPGTGEVIADAAPRTLYVMRPVLNGAEIIKWAKEQGFKTTLPADDLHVTIAFSREAVDWMKVGESWGDQIRVPEGGARLMEQFGEARVLLFSSSELSWRHEEIRRAGASWDHAEYQPHITISYDEAAPDVAEVEPYRGEIILGPETFQEVKENSAIG
jgi:hypothetical protein